MKATEILIYEKGEEIENPLVFAGILFWKWGKVLETTHF